MNLSPPQLGPHLKIASLALFTTLLLLLIFSFFPISKGQAYFNRLNRYRRLVLDGQYLKSDQLAKKLDSSDIDYFSKHNHPSFITQTIKDILKKSNRSTDDLIEVALLYKKIKEFLN